MLKRVIKCLPVLLAALLLTGCGELSTPELAGRLASVIGTADAAEARSVLGMPEEEKEEEGSAFSPPSCEQLVPNGIPADGAELSMSRYLKDTIASVQLRISCYDMSLSDVYQTMKRMSDSMYAEYTESALDEIYTQYNGAFNQDLAPFIEKYPTEEDFQAAFDAISDSSVPILRIADCWWLDEENEVYFGIEGYFSEEETAFILAVEDDKAVEDYFIRLGPMM